MLKRFLESNDNICCIFLTFDSPDRADSVDPNDAAGFTDYSENDDHSVDDQEDSKSSEIPTSVTDSPSNSSMRPSERIKSLQHQFHEVSYALILVTFNSLDIISKGVNELFMTQLQSE